MLSILLVLVLHFFAALTTGISSGIVVDLFEEFRALSENPDWRRNAAGPLSKRELLLPIRATWTRKMWGRMRRRSSGAGSNCSPLRRAKRRLESKTIYKLLCFNRTLRASLLYYLTKPCDIKHSNFLKKKVIRY